MAAPAASVPSAAPDTPPPPTIRTPWRSGLRWFLAEFVVVVAGVLVALALTSWAQDRRDVHREQAYLRQLTADLLTNERLLAEAVAFSGQRAAASARVLQRFWRTAPAVDATLVDDLSLPRTTRRFRPEVGTVEALISSGELDLVRSDALRASLLAYVETTRTRLEDIQRYDETYYRPAVAMLQAGPDLHAYYRFRTRDHTLLPRPASVERVPFPTTLAAMMRDRVVYDGYNFLLIAHRNQSSQYDLMLDETQALRASIDAATGASRPAPGASRE